MNKLTIAGYALAKIKGTVAPKQCRVILPQSNSLTICNTDITREVKEALDEWEPKDSTIYIGGGNKRTQTADITAAAHMAVETALDLHSEIGIATADITAFHDSIPMPELKKAMQQTKLKDATIAACVRLHTKPEIKITVGAQEAKLKERTRGVMTGSTSAPQLARVPIIDTAAKRRHHWAEQAFSFGHDRLSFACWVDNLVSFGRNSPAATEIIRQTTETLQKDWRLEVTPGSRMCLRIQGEEAKDGQAQNGKG
eukprot:TRINITY_DN42706_c0_g1_i1.p1 TRINITY_DN42706_c0_g1~~TRINITY_DN42706_c0_g1_i1.p1  ORF type:complete len:255 (-),score=26.42 TRINITY_DN42706_c0_g1_i1:135-899(-)